MLAALVLLSALFYIFVRFLLNYAVFSHWQKKKVPFVKPNIFFGNLWNLITQRQTWFGFVHGMHKRCIKDGYIGVFVMQRPALVVSDLEIIKDILIKDFDYFTDNWLNANPRVDPLLAANLFVLKGKQKWRNTRNLLTSQLTNSKLKLMCPALQDVGKNLQKFINTEKTKQKSTCIELANLSARFTSDAVLRCGYGLDGNSFLDEIPESFKISGTPSKDYNKMSTLKQTFGLNNFFSKLFTITYNGDPFNHNLFSDIILNSIKARLQNNVVSKDFLNHFMELKNDQKIDNDELIGQVFTLYLDGVETSYYAMVYALLELSLNQNVQDKARDAVETVLQKYNGQLSFEAYRELRYLENIIFETLRKYPPTLSMAKTCTRDYVVHDVKNGKSFTIDKKTPVFWSLHGIHHNPEFYPEPEKFDPDRFTDEAKQTRPKYSFLGFGDGPRVCIGRKYAVLQLVFAVAAILSEFDLKFNKKTVYPIDHEKFHFFAKPVYEVYVDFVQRPK